MAEYNRKYTKEIIEEAVKPSVNIAEVLRRLGIKQSGGMQSHIKKMIGVYGINTTHFLGARTNSGANHKGGTDKVTWRDVLVYDRLNGAKEKSFRLKRAMLEGGIPYRCSAKGCAVIDTWNGKPIVLHIDHINGDWLDNRPENVRFLCANCHTQTETYGGRNK